MPERSSRRFVTNRTGMREVRRLSSNRAWKEKSSFSTQSSKHRSSETNGCDRMPLPSSGFISDAMQRCRIRDGIWSRDSIFRMITSPPIMPSLLFMTAFRVLFSPRPGDVCHQAFRPREKCCKFTTLANSHNL